MDEKHKNQIIIEHRRRQRNMYIVYGGIERVAVAAASLPLSTFNRIRFQNI